MFWNNHSKKQIKYFLLSEDAVCFIKHYAMPAMKLHFPIDDATLSAIVDFATQWEIDMIDPLNVNGCDKTADYPEKERNEAADRFVTEITGQWTDFTIPDLEDLNRRLGFK